MPKITQAEKTKLLGSFAVGVVERFSIELNVNLSPSNNFNIPKTKKYLPPFKNPIQGLM